MPNKSYLSFPSVRLFSLLEIVSTFDTVVLEYRYIVGFFGIVYLSPNGNFVPISLKKCHSV